VVERHALEAQLPLRAEFDQLTPAHRRRQIARGALEARQLGAGAEVGRDDDPLEAGYLGGDLGDGVEAVEVLAAVAVAVDAEHDLGLDLGKAVDDAGGSEVG